MSLSEVQQGVLRGMIVGAVASAVLIACGALLNPAGYPLQLPLQHRFSIAAAGGAVLAFCLAVAIARLARHRFFSTQDIEGRGLHPGSLRAALLQALLQNTLEQSVLAFLVYLAWAARMPATTLSVIPLAAAAFFVGRVLFFAGYEKGPAARSLGFTLSFYPTIGMLACIIGVEVWGWFN